MCIRDRDFKRYAADAVIRYDIAYRQSLANNHGRFGQIDEQARRENLEGRSKIRCHECDEPGHVKHRCPMRKVHDKGNADIKAPNQHPAMKPDSRSNQGGSSFRFRTQSFGATSYYKEGTCNRFNNGSCNYRDCRFKHNCNRCGASGHPAFQCSRYGNYKSDFKPDAKTAV